MQLTIPHTIVLISRPVPQAEPAPEINAQTLAAEFFGNIKLTTEELSSFMTAMKDARMDEEEIARKWRDEHRLLVDSWIPKSENK